MEKSRNKLDNPGFLSNAPEKVVTELREKVIDTEKHLRHLSSKFVIWRNLQTESMSYESGKK